MKRNSRLAAVLALGVIFSTPALAYVEVPLTLGKIVNDSTNILLMRVEKVDREKNLVIFRKVKDIKGKHPTDVIKHNIGRAGFNPREWQYAMEGCQVGNHAMFFHNGSASETYVQNYWYQTYPGEWWAMSHGEPFLLRSYAGKPEKLAGIVANMLAGQEVVVPCMVDDKATLHTRAAKIQRMKASLKIQDYNAKRDFVGWGNEDFRALQGMPAFTQYTAITRTDPEAAGVAPIDFDADGKIDLCAYGTGKVALLKNAGTSLDEIPLPSTGGARAAAWADWNGDARPDLLLAAPAGPVLLTNQGNGTFKDDTAALPKESFYALTTAAWIDQDADKKPDILLANGFLGLRLYRNAGAKFEDVSDKVGLGGKGLGAGQKGFHLAVADLDGDGRPDFFYTGGAGVVATNTPGGFVAVKDAGLALKPGPVAPAVADFDNDAKPDITLVDGNQIRLFKNDGKARFTDVTGQRGDLSKPVDNVACLAWSDFNNQGRQDLLVGVTRGPNRFFRNTGDGKYADASDEIGLTQKVFNTRAISVVDLNGDTTLDVVFNNEGQESSVLLGNPKRAAKNTASIN